MDYIRGKYKKAIFTSDNGYVIGLFKVKETNQEDVKDYLDKTLTFTGYFADLNENDDYIFYGELINHPKYGYQYQVKEYEKIKPQDKEGIIAFLSSDIFPGIGEKMATKIVEVLGNSAIDKILEDESCLNLVPKLSQQKIKGIKSILEKHEESNKIMIYLTDLGFNMQDSLSIYNKYKANTIINIENDIFNLIDDIDNINFAKIDQISKKLGVEENDKRRIKACFVYIMEVLTFKKGDTYLLYDEIKNNLNKYLKITVDDELLKLYIDELRVERKIVLENNKFYLKKIFDDEQNIVDSISQLVNKDIEKNKNIDKYIKMSEEENEISYNQKQKEAIKKALENNILIITGGPGTGKTTIIETIVEIYKEIKDLTYDDLIDKIALLAPTGRASKRMSEATNLPATTIHRFLKWNKENNEFMVNETNKDFSELVIIDEVSMIDINLFSSLFKGITTNAKLILVGDYNQLPSVGAGNILKDLIDCQKIDTIYLDLLYRQDENSYINNLAHDIKNGNLSEEFLKTKNDYAFLNCSSDSILETLKTTCQRLVEKDIDQKRIQLMAPMYAGINGIDNLNKELQKIFNPEDHNKNEIRYGDIVFRENDKILQLVNMPDDNVFNGDVGYIKYIIKAANSKSKKNEIYVDYDGNVVKYLPKDFNKIKHGFIISIHKSQGSEFDLVIIPICMSYYRMLYRKLIYTAITRAKKKLIIIGEANAFKYSVDNNNEYIRKTNLCEKLKNMYND